MQTELITVATSDGVELDGAIYRPVAGSPRRGASILMVHGLTWNFYRGPSRWLPPLLAAQGYACLSLNMRDHDLSEPKDFALAHHDLRAGIDHLAGAGSGDVVLLAHGFACNKVVCYPAMSGDHAPRRSILATLGAVKAYRPEIWDMVMRSAAAMRGETLIVQGAADPLIAARERADELVAAAAASRVETVMLEGANHYFDQRRAELANSILRWLANLQRGGDFGR
jgi:alpha-beta hydrolase superfamily lysophospholipase